MSTELDAIDPNDPAYSLILACLKHEPEGQRGIVFSSMPAFEAIVAAGGQTRQQLFGATQGLLVREMAMTKIGDWTMTAAFERPATKEDAQAEFDRLLASFGAGEPSIEPAPVTTCTEVGTGAGVYNAPTHEQQMPTSAADLETSGTQHTPSKLDPI